MEEFRKVGDSEIRIEGNVVFVKHTGDVTPEAVNAAQTAMNELRSRHDKTFFLFDLTRAGAFQPEARKLVAEWERKHPTTAVACFGATTMMRVIHKLLATAMSLMGKPTTFAAFHTEREARAWIEAEQRRHD